MHGHSLLEVLTAVAVAGVLSAIALPSFTGFIADHRRVTAVNGLVSALNRARHASVMHARAVTVCPAGGDTRCGSDWSRGAWVVVEPRGWVPKHAVPADALLHEGAESGAVRVTANRTRFRFRPYRRRATNGTLVACVPGRTPRAVVVAPSGRVRTTGRIPGWGRDACRPSG